MSTARRRRRVICDPCLDRVGTHPWNSAPAFSAAEGVAPAHAPPVIPRGIVA